MGTGVAQFLISDPRPTKLAVVTVNIARIGDVLAMVDSGSMVGVVRRHVVENLFKDENKLGGFVVGFDKGKVPIIGEMALTVRFGDHVVDRRLRWLITPYTT